MKQVEFRRLALRWPTRTVAENATRLRIAVAQFMRSTCKIEATLARSGRALGTFDIRFPSLFQPYEITLAPGDGPSAVREGVALRMTEGTLPFWTWTDGDGCPTELRPHLLVPGAADPMTEFHARIGSLACIQSFGWEEGSTACSILPKCEGTARSGTPPGGTSRFICVTGSKFLKAGCYSPT